MAKTATIAQTSESKKPHVAPSGNNTERVERAELRTAEAEARTEHAQTRTEQAETRAEQAETRTEAAETALQRVIEKDFAPDEKIRKTDGKPGSLDPLTARQREILTLIAQGQNTKMIAATL